MTTSANLHPFFAILAAAKRYPFPAPDESSGRAPVTPDAPTPPAGNIIPMRSPSPPAAAFSLFANCKAAVPSGRLTLQEFIAGVRNGRWRAEVENCRAILAKDGKEAYNAARMALPAVSLSAAVRHRRKGTALAERGAVHSGWLQLDLDAKDHPGMTVAEIKAKVHAAPFVTACFVSLSGAGIKAIALCPANFDTHAGSWLAAQAYFAAQGLTLDPATKDPMRLCFVSSDPEAFEWDEGEEIAPLEVPERSGDGDAPPDRRSSGNVRPEWAREVLAELAAAYPRPDYPDWRDISSAVFGGVGVETGIELLQEVWPEEREAEYAALARSFQWFAEWETLRSFGVNPSDPEALLAFMPELDPLEEEGEEETGAAKQSLRERAYALRFDPDAEPPPDELCMTIGDYPVAARGNLTVIQGKSKVGKSAVVAAVLGSCQRGQCAGIGDTLCFEWQGDSTGAIIHLDTEQSRADWHASVRRSVTRSGRPCVSPRLVSLPLVRFARSERLAILEQSLAHESRTRGGVDCVVIDGIADLSASPNDEEASLEFVSKIMALAQEHAVPVYCVLHENPSSQDAKTRGHLGSELNRKAFANLRIDKDTEASVSTIYGTDMRKRDIPKNQGFCFAWNDAAGMHTFCGRAAGMKDGQQKSRAKEKARTEWKGIFESVEIGTNGDCPELTPEQAVEALRDISGTEKEVTPGAMKKRMQRAESLGVLRKTGAGTWTLNPAGQSGQFRDI